MCGFSGFLSGSDEGLGTEPNNDIMALLKQRGPDAQRALKFENGVFYHARLAIQDPGVGANQPFTAGDYVLVFNGEIYNHKRLRKEYSLQCQDDSDTATIAALVKKRGAVSAIQCLEGMFAIAVFDRRTRELTLARDPYGQKPLYLNTNGDIVFSSVLSTFVQHFSTQLCDLDGQGISDYLALGYGLGSRTILKNVRRVLPGEVVKVSWDGKSYSVASQVNCLKPHNFSGQEGGKIQETVDDCLLSDRGVGVLLSGGLDSSSVAAAMKNSGLKFTAYTLGFSDSSFDETHTAIRTAQTIRCDHKNFKYTAKEATEVFDNLSSMFDDPIADPSMIPTAVLMRSISANDVVVLGGDGGDEQFGGYRRYKMARYAKKVLRVPYQVRHFFIPILDFTIWRSQRVRALYSSIGLGRPAENWGKFKAVMAARNLPEMASALVCGSFYLKDIFRDITNDNLEKALIRFDLDHFLPNSVLMKVDRASMAFGVECRAPFLSGKWASMGGKEKDGKEGVKDFLKGNDLSFLIKVPKTGFGSPPKFFDAVESYRSSVKSMHDSSLFKSLLDKYEVPSTEFRKVVLFKWLVHYEVI